MRLTRKNHSACLVGYAALFLEIIVSSYFCKLDSFFFVTRLGVALVYFTAVEKLYIDLLKWVSVIIITLSVSSVVDQLQKISASKFEKGSQLETTKIKSPDKPKLEDCSLQPKYARPECARDNKELQDKYSKALEKYNKKIETSETNVKNLDTSLDFLDIQPVLIYCILIGGITILSVLGVKRPEETSVKKSDTSNLALPNIEKVKLIESRNEKEKISQAKLCEEYGISLSEFKRLRAKDKPKLEPKEKTFPGLEGLEEVSV